MMLSTTGGAEPCVPVLRKRESIQHADLLEQKPKVLAGVSLDGDRGLDGRKVYLEFLGVGCREFLCG
jgi:hypothetical protein